MKKRPLAESAAEEGPTLAISPEQVCFIIMKAREFEVKDVVTDPDAGSNPSDDQMISVLEDHPDDPVQHELTEFISALDEDRQIDLVTLAWLGRDDNTVEDWSTLREEAQRVHRAERHFTARYLIGMPLVSEYLEEALSMLGLSCEAYEAGRL